MNLLRRTTRELENKVNGSRGKVAKMTLEEQKELFEQSVYKALTAPRDDFGEHLIDLVAVKRSWDLDLFGFLYIIFSTMRVAPFKSPRKDTSA